jgi:hypothetical protein
MFFEPVRSLSLVFACGGSDSFQERGALFLIIQDRSVHEGATIDTFPSVENDEKIGEPFQIHQTFTLWASHFCSSSIRLATQMYCCNEYASSQNFHKTLFLNLKFSNRYFC